MVIFLIPLYYSAKITYLEKKWATKEDFLIVCNMPEGIWQM